MLRGFVSVMDEFDPLLHGQDKVPPVFCTDQAAYDYFRTLAIQDRIAGAQTKLQSKKTFGALAKALDVFNLDVPEINTLYVSSCFDPRFAGPKQRKKFLQKVGGGQSGQMQVVESFLNSGWIVYEVEAK